VQRSASTASTELDHVEAAGGGDGGFGSEHWVTIQRNTFANWVTEVLRARSAELGLASGSSVDLQRDLGDGRLLCALVEQLRQRRRAATTGVAVNAAVRRPINQHQCIDNINRALRAMTDDGIRLVNIGSFSQ